MADLDKQEFRRRIKADISDSEAWGRYRGAFLREGRPVFDWLDEVVKITAQPVKESLMQVVKLLDPFPTTDHLAVDEDLKKFVDLKEKACCLKVEGGTLTMGN